jgi:hypothetical protein
MGFFQSACSIEHKSKVFHMDGSPREDLVEERFKDVSRLGPNLHAGLAESRRVLFPKDRCECVVIKPGAIRPQARNMG